MFVFTCLRKKRQGNCLICYSRIKMRVKQRHMSTSFYHIRLISMRLHCGKWKGKPIIRFLANFAVPSTRNEIYRDVLAL